MEPVPSPHPRLRSRIRKSLGGFLIAVIASAIANYISNGSLWHLVFPQHHLTPPLVVNVPGTIRATSKTNDGIRIAYQASALSDRPNANPQVRCQPPSNSVFAIGSTTVACAGTDVFGDLFTKRFQVMVEGPPPPPPPRPPTAGALRQALIKQSDLPGSPAPEDPSGYTDVGVGQIWACGDETNTSGSAFPTSGQAAAVTAAFKTDSTALAGDSVFSQAVSFYGDSARNYMDDLVKAIQTCPPYDNRPKIEAGPSLGGQTVWLSAGQVSYIQEDVFVRVDSAIVAVAYISYGDTTNRGLLQQLVQVAANRLVKAERNGQ